MAEMLFTLFGFIPSTLHEIAGKSILYFDLRVIFCNIAH